MVRADDPPADAHSTYSTFWAPSDFMDVMGTDGSGDPFASHGGEPPPKPSPPVVWKENLGFFEIGSVEEPSSIFIAAGIPWDPAKEVAFFHKQDQRLYVRSSRETAELIDQFMGGFGPSPSRSIEIEVLVIGLTDPAAYKTLAESEDARVAAEALAADRARIVARASLLTRSGHRASLGQGPPPGTASAPSSPGPPPAEPTDTRLAPAPTPAPSPAPSPARREPGLLLQAEPILGADGSSIDLSIDFAFGLRVAPGDVAPITGSLITSVTVRSGRPVLQRLSLEGAPWPEVALVLTATVKLADVDGWKNGVRQLLPREEAWRALGLRHDDAGAR